MANETAKFGLKDLSIVIPTYNRAKDLGETLKSLMPHLKELGEIIIVDQSRSDETQVLIKKMKNKKIKYVFSQIPAITIARNIGVKKCKKSSKLICFIDDDVDLGENYFSKILEIFNTYKDAKAAAGYFTPEKIGSFDNILRKIFLIRNLEKNSARIISAYGNTYPKNLTRVINAQWLPGVNMVYKKRVFEEQKFDENLLGYTIGEDIDFSYRLWKKYQDSVFITPFASIKHRASLAEREPTARMAYINQIDHFYFNFKNLNKGFIEKNLFAWSLFGISLLRLLNLVFKPSKNNYLKLKYFFKSLFYCLKNTKMIKAGKLRNFTA